MQHVGHMNYFNVNECGLYKSGSQKIYGCELNETFDLLQIWLKDKELAKTNPWDITSSKQSKCYCKDIYKDDRTGDFLIVLWKSDTDSTGTLWGAQEDSTQGNDGVVKYTDKYKGKKVIWGRPCYYWVITELNCIVSMKFDHSVCDTNLFQDWVVGSINYKVKHPNRDKEVTQGGAIRLTYTTKNENTPNRLSYRFDLGLKSLNTSKSELSKLAVNVTHVVKRETITIEEGKNERADWIEKISQYLPDYVSRKPKTNTRNIELRIEAKPTVDEIKNLIEKYAKENRKRSEWENLGFETKTGTTWVDRYRLKDYIHISTKEKSTFSAVELYENIYDQRERFLKPLVQSIEITGS